MTSFRKILTELNFSIGSVGNVFYVGKAYLYNTYIKKSQSSLISDDSNKNKNQVWYSQFFINSIYTVSYLHIINEGTDHFFKTFL